MNLDLFNRLDESTWEISPQGLMKVPARIIASETLVRLMDQKVFEQLSQVATLPGLARGVFAMPDAHWGYGFPIGGVAAFDPKMGGVVSAGGVGFDISCGVRLLHTGMKISEIDPHKESLADLLYRRVPSGVGSRSEIRLSDREMDEMILGGARWALRQGFGREQDLAFIEDHGQIEGASPEAISQKAKDRQKPEMGTLGSGNHYLEIQEVQQIFNAEAAKAFGLSRGDVVVSIHCGSRGLGHQIGTEYLRLMATSANQFGIELPNRELAAAPIDSELGKSYIGAMRGATNCALANRQIITHFTRKAFSEIFPHADLRLVYDISHNTCKEEWHDLEGEKKMLLVHRKGATRALGPGHSEIPEIYRHVGQPVFIGGSMGVGSYVLVGTQENENISFSSSCHGAGRAMSRTEAQKKWAGQEIIDELRGHGIVIRSGSFRGVAEEAPNAYKNLHDVVESAELSHLSKRVAYLKPLVCIKG